MLNQKALSASVTGPDVDANFKQTVLLLHGDGTNGAQNNTFTDSSTNAFTITRNGNTTQGTFSPFSVAAGEWSVYFDGNGDEISTNKAAISGVGSSNFSIECWVYATRQTNTYAQGLVSYGPAGSTIGTSYLSFQLTNAGYLACAYATAGSLVVTDTDLFPINQWVHAVVCRSGSTISLFVNGTRKATASTSATVGSTGDVLTIGGQWISNDAGRQLEGYLSNVRIVNGSSAYDATASTITVPTTPLTAITNTTLLTSQSNRFIDNSSSAYTITPAGNTSVQPFSPFAPSAAYSTSTNGGSGYFDGTGDYLTTTGSMSLGSGDFTVGCWIYLTAAPVAETPILCSTNYYRDTYNGNFVMRVGTANLFNSFDGQSSGADISGTYSWQINTWIYVAWVRSGSTITVYRDGTSLGTVSSSRNLSDSANGVYIAANIINNSVQSNYFQGFISGLRVLVGTADSAVPTAPPTAITNTKLLLNYTNAGIYDSTAKNVLETVGNAQIDTGTKKFGTGSMEFDGTGDWLLMPNTPDQQLGTGNFTIEFWVYLASGDTGSNRGLVAKGTSTTGFLVSLNTTEKVVFTYATSTITSSGAITTNAWNHIAVVREGTGSNQTKIYIGGTNDGTGTVSTDFNQTSVMYVGANRTGGDPMKGFIDDLRITKGVARYTANFTPPAKAFADQ